jgi:hypothetical protein
LERKVRPLGESLGFHGQNFAHRPNSRRQNSQKCCHIGVLEGVVLWPNVWSPEQNIDEDDSHNMSHYAKQGVQRRACSHLPSNCNGKDTKGLC